MIFLFFGGKIVCYLLKYNHHCEIFIVFVRLLSLIVAIWVRLVKLIGEKEDLITKMKYKMKKKKKNLGPRGPRPPPESVPV